MADEKSDVTFYEQVAAAPGGERLKLCLQCGTCGGSCPSGPDMDHSPRDIFALIMAGQKKEVLQSNTFWYCVSCYYCTVRCPQEIPITDIMYRLKHLAIAAGQYTSAAKDWSSTFIGQVESFGRSFELGIATQYYLTHRPLGMVGMMPMAIGMLTRGRMALLPTRIKDLVSLRAILRKAKEIAAQREGQVEE
ncbi:MAG: 4Fe-4S dicluster domain-containing protein [Thermoflexales bacterium]|nr:4Fe-4S dicluster domain-containing protein [Thermoflexales bacterium]